MRRVGMNGMMPDTEIAPATVPEASRIGAATQRMPGSFSSRS